jgi:endo-1,4-beta-xylanase
MQDERYFTTPYSSATAPSHVRLARWLAAHMLEVLWGCGPSALSISCILILLVGCGESSNNPYNTYAGTSAIGASGSGGFSTSGSGGSGTGGGSGAGGTINPGSAGAGIEAGAGGAGAGGAVTSSGGAGGAAGTAGTDLFDGGRPNDGGGATGGTGGAGGTGGVGGTAGSGGSGGQSLWKFVGNITTGWDHRVDTNGRTFSTYWDQITPENAGKWGSVQPTANSGFNWAALDAIYDYAQRTGIIFKEHTFVWGSQQPSGTLTETHVRTWMQQFCSRYPNTALIDVVNEPPPHTTPDYANAIGGGTNTTWQWIINAFNWAREYCPNAILILNDYNNIEWPDQNRHFIDIANTVKAAGAPIDAVGAQAHGLSEMVSTQTMQNLLTKLHEDTGLPVYITEYDIDLANDQAQLDKYQQHIPFFLNTEWIHGITLWGWIHGATWVPDSGIIRPDGTPRPAMTWLMETLGRPAP